MRKLNVGAGNVPLKGYINVDKHYYPSSDNPLLDKREVDRWEDTENQSWIYGDAIALDFPDETFDEVIMIHALEHLSMEHGNLAIKELYRVLKPGGTVEIEVPDLTRACELFLQVHVTPDGNNQPWHRVMGLLYGTTGGDGEGQFHLCGYSQEYLAFKLDERGFKNIEVIPVGFGHGDDTEHGHGEPEYDFRMKATK